MTYCNLFLYIFARLTAMLKLMIFVCLLSCITQAMSIWFYFGGACRDNESSFEFQWI